MDGILLYIPIVLSAGIAMTARITQKSWYSPGAFFALLWTALMLLPLVGAPDYPVSYESVWMIFLFMLAVNTGVEAGMCVSLLKRRGICHTVRGSAATLRLPFLTLITVVMCFMGVLCTLLTMHYANIRLTEMMSLDGWVGVAAKMSVLRYLDKYTEPLIVRLLLIGFYGGGLFGGLLFRLGETRLRKAIGVLPVIAAIGYTLVTTAKAAFLFTAVMWGSSYIAIIIYTADRRLSLFTGKNIRRFLAGMAAVFFFFMVTLMGRAGVKGLPEFDEVYNPMRSYLFSYLPAFSNWIENGGLRSDEFSLGQYTFAGVFEAAGIKKREQGVYAESVDFGEHQESNIYTVYRGLITDFGLAGALTGLFVFGFIAGFSFRRVMSGAKGFIPLLVMSYMFLFWSPIASIFNYNSIVAGWVLFAAYVIIGCKSKGGRMPATAAGPSF